MSIAHSKSEEEEKRSRCISCKIETERLLSLWQSLIFDFDINKKNDIIQSIEQIKLAISAEDMDSVLKFRSHIEEMLDVDVIINKRLEN